MKLEVGKTYKTADGQEVYIQTQLVHALGGDCPVGTFLGVFIANPRCLWLKEDGSNIFARSVGLVPSIRTVTGWGRLFGPVDLADIDIGLSVILDEYVFDTEKAAQSYFQPSAKICKITVEIEE